MQVRYNDVILQDALMSEFNEECVYDSTGIDVIGHKIRMSFEGNISHGNIKTDYCNHNRYLTYGEQGPEKTQNNDTASVEASFAVVRRALLQARQTLLVTFGACPASWDDSNARSAANTIRGAYGSSFLLVLPMCSTTFGVDGGLSAILENDSARDYTGAVKDVAAGPLPRSVSILLTTPYYMRIRFTIDVTIIECFRGSLYTAKVPEVTDKGINAGHVIVTSSKWTCTESMDSDFYTTRRYTGALRLSSNFVSAHIARRTFVPPLEDGFLRESVEYSETKDGFGLEFSVTDKQVKYSPPYPATSIDGYLTMSTDASMQHTVKKVSITLTGPPHISLEILRDRAIQCCFERSQYLDSKRLTNNGVILTNISISEKYGPRPAMTASLEFTDTALIKRGTNSFMTSAEYAATVANNKYASVFGSSLNLFGKPWVLKPLIDEEGNQWIYESTRGKTPDPYGYASCDTTAQRKFTALFIKSLASNACAPNQWVKTLVTYYNDTDMPSKFEDNEDESSKNKQPTKVTHVEPGSIVPAMTDTLSLESKFFLPTSYKSSVVYKDTGVKVQCPTALRTSAIGKNGEYRAAPVTCRVQQVAASMLKAYVTIDAEQVGRPPAMPDPTEAFVASSVNATTTVDNWTVDSSNSDPSRTPGLAHYADLYDLVTTPETTPAPAPLPPIRTSTTVDYSDPLVVVPISHKLTLDDPVRDAADSAWIYSAKGEYVFACSRPLGKGDIIQMLWPGFRERAASAVSYDFMYRGNQFSHIANS